MSWKESLRNGKGGDAIMPVLSSRLKYQKLFAKGRIINLGC